MPHILDAESFLALRDAGLPLLDARSPGEYAHGHIPGALNLPVLDDEERAAVGTAHARSGREGAVHLALKLVGPQLAAKLARARKLFQEHQAALPPQAGKLAETKSRDVLVHCWRGGMRSASLAWLLETGGYAVHVLAGGYKAYRTWVRDALARPASVLVLGGMTGSGKTDMLAELALLGSQVIDLEGLAGHRGSAFGGVGLGGQPSNESVENALADLWRGLDPTRPVWLEDEDRRIGTVSLCGEFFEHIRTGRLVRVDVPFEARVDRLVRMYTGPEHRDALAACVERLTLRLGGEAARRCVEDIRADRYREAVTAILGYYDKLYARQMEKHGRSLAGCVTLERDDPAEAARRLKEVERSWGAASEGQA